MLFRRVESEGLAHYSYLVADEGEAAVIDPRRDCGVYVDAAQKQGHRVKHVLETHRNEDYLVGSPELEYRTGAEVWHADDQWSYGYGLPVEDGQTWDVGRLTLEAMHTPGHTPGHMSYVLRGYEDEPWMAFTGDALFAGDVGRVDLMGPDRMEEAARKLHHSIFDRILPLGDGVLLHPAHGPGSACGSSIAERTRTTIGLEKQLNPRLVPDRDRFVEEVAEELERPPYFDRMERQNLEGPPVLGHLPSPPPLSPAEFDAERDDGVVVDTRSVPAFGAAHVPGAQSLWRDGLPRFAGWLLEHDEPVLLVTETDDVEETVRYLLRIGYDHISGYLSGDMLNWHTSGRESTAIDTVTVQELCRRLDSDDPTWLLDVRSDEELEEDGRITGAHHVHVTQLPERLDEVPRDTPVYVFCGTGLRSMIAASLLRRNGWENVAVTLGGFEGWISTTCPVT